MTVRSPGGSGKAPPAVGAAELEAIPTKERPCEDLIPLSKMPISVETPDATNVVLLTGTGTNPVGASVAGLASEVIPMLPKKSH